MAESVTIRIDDDIDDHEGGEAKTARSRAPLEADEGTRRAYAQRLHERRNNDHAVAMTQLSEIRAHMASAEERIKSHFETGDTKRLTEEQRRLSQLAARELQIDERRAAIEAYQVGDRDPVREYVRSRDPETQRWMEENPEAARAMALNDAGMANAADAELARSIHRAHDEAVKSGHKVNSKEYFRDVEGRIAGKRADQEFDEGNTDIKRAGGKTTVRLTAGELERSEDGSITWGAHDVRAGRCKPELVGEPIGKVEYAKRKAKMASEGYYDRRDD